MIQKTRTKSSRFIAMLLAIIMVVTAMPMTVLTANAVTASGNTTEFAGGSGTVEDPYLISTKFHLDNVRKYPTSDYKMISDIEFVDADFDSGGQYYNGGRYWLPIETFSGTFNGNAKKISGLKGPGLFGDVYNADINNLHIENHSIGPILFKSSMYGGNDGYCAGGIACAIKNSTISNCFGTDFTLSVTTDGPIGGLIGVSYSSTIKNCEFKIDNNGVWTEENHIGLICAFAESSTIDKCKSSGILIVYGENSLGGIVGLARTCSITNCENSATLKANEVWNSGCGGIVGYFTYGGDHSDSGIANCKNSGEITCTGTSADAGGIAGVVFDGLQQITLCENEGTVYGSETAGGIIGLCNSSSGVDISNCVNRGKISGYEAGGFTGYLVEGCLESVHNTGEIKATSSCGGIAGVSKGSIQKSSNIGTIMLSSRSSNVVYIGGIAGLNYSTIAKCYNSGEIEANCYSAKVGGIAGVNQAGGKIEDSYNIGDIQCDYTANNKIYTTGGICGENNQPTQAIVNCYNIGRIPEVDDDIGLICGYNSKPGEAFKNCYVVEGEIIPDVGFGYGDGSAIKLTEEQMRSASNFSGFDFESVWTMTGNEEYSYPELKSVEMIYVPFVPGDVTGDDKINSLDGLLLMRYLNGWNVNIASSEAMDVNGDGKVNSLDGLILMRYLNGWNVTLG